MFILYYRLNKIVYEVKLFPEDHTGDNIATTVDAIIEKHKELQDITITAVVDQASNMAVGLRKSKYVESLEDGSMQCLDHKLNTCLRKSIVKDPVLEKAFDKARNLASNMHQSGKKNKKLRRACRLSDVRAIKIPTLSLTRWNGHQKILDAIIRMRVPLLKLSSENKDFGKIVPSLEEMDLFEELLPFLTEVKQLSEWFSNDSEPRMDQALVRVFCLFACAEKMCTSSQSSNTAKAFFTEFLKNLHEKFPQRGVGIFPMAVGNLLHPYFKGHLLGPEIHNVVRTLVSSHKTTAQFQSQLMDTDSSESLLAEPPSPVSQPEPRDGMMAAYDLMINEINNLDGFVQDRHSSGIPPLQEEFNTFLSMPRPDSSVPPLKWWMINAPKLPLLTELLRGYLGMPVSLASSERAFSQAGQVITDERYNLSPDLASKCIFVKTNFSTLVPYVEKWFFSKSDMNEKDETSDEEAESPSFFEATPGLEGLIHRKPLAGLQEKNLINPDFLNILSSDCESDYDWI